MSGDDPYPGTERGVSKPGGSQHARATGNARVMQAGRDQYILNLGNILWLIVPVALAVFGLVVYRVVASPASALGPSGNGVRHSTSPVARQAQRSPPLAMAVAYDQNHVDNGAPSCMNWIFKRPLSSIPVPPDNNVDETWAHRFGGVDQSVTNFKITVQGLTPNAVQLIDFRVVNVVREPAISGIDIVGSCGGESEEAGFAIALGSNPPTVTRLSSLDNGIAKAIPFPFVVSNTDIQQFQVTAIDHLKPGQRGCDCLVKWRLALDWSYEGKTGTSVIDDNGRAFQTLFLTGRYFLPGVSWTDGGGHWSRR
jgi:hypothetical protein